MQIAVITSAFIQNIMISDKTFQLAKNIGFDLKTCNCGGFPECICYEVKPTQFILQKWLREKHNYHTEIYCHNEEKKVLWNYTISNNSFSLKGNEYYSTYEFALENALIHLIKIISTQSCSQAE